MISGEVSEDRQVLATIEIIDADGRSRPVEVALDTGFTGYLTLPEATIRQLGLVSAGRRTFELANGELSEFEAYLASVSWHGKLTDIVALRSDNTPLLGMALLWGSRVTMDAVVQGEVSIRELQSRASEDKQYTPDKGGLWERAKQTFFNIAFLISVIGVFLAIVYSFTSLTLTFGEIVTFMGICLAIGAILGQNKPPTMPITQYIGRRKIGIFCCYAFLVMVAIAYSLVIDQGISEGISTKELLSIVALSLVGFAIGFFAGQDKERKRQ